MAEEKSPMGIDDEEKKQYDPATVMLEKDKADIEKNKWMAVLCYLSILCLIPLFLRKESKYVRFHAKQGLVLLFIQLAIPLLNLIPIVGQFLWVCSVIVLLLYVVLGVKNAWQGRFWEMPYIGYYARQINI
jgi:uncharacterized membrane protein